MAKRKRKPRSRRWFEELLDRDPCIVTPAVLDALTTKEIGDLGESIAARHLYDHGYELIEFSYRCAEGEADLIACDPCDGQVVLVEVKTRRVSSPRAEIFPEEAVTARKQSTYRRIAALFAMENFPVPAIRFDVIAVTLIPGYPPAIDHIEGAFDWDAGL